MKTIELSSIPHHEHRYETAGDWFTKDNVVQVRVSEIGNWKYEMLVAVHELVEAMLCWHDGVPEEMVDQFDTDFEKNRPQGDHSEPGDDPRAPYRKQHFIATNIERQLAVELGVDWQEYERAIEVL